MSANLNLAKLLRILCEKQYNEGYKINSTPDKINLNLMYQFSEIHQSDCYLTTCRKNNQWIWNLSLYIIGCCLMQNIQWKRT